MVSSQRLKEMEEGELSENSTLLSRNDEARKGCVEEMSAFDFAKFLWTNVVESEPLPGDCLIQKTLHSDERKIIPDDALVPFVTIALLGVILTIVCSAVTYHFAWRERNDWIWRGALYGLMGFGYNKMLHSIKIPIKLVWYRLMGLTYHSTATASGPRDRWTPETVSAFIEVYGLKRIKVVDAVTRRFGHCLDHMFRDMFWTPFAVSSQVQRIVNVFVLYTFKLLDKGFFLRRNNLLASAAFQGARIRDGRLARINLLSVIISGGALYPICMLILWLGLRNQIDEADFSWLVAYVAQSTTWGDTAAEVVGSFYGKLEFKVFGFGEVNRKTIEGCTACFVASFASSMLWTVPAGFPSDTFQVSVTTLSCLVALTGTVVETISFRGTDNGLMMLSSVLVLVACSKSPF